MKKYNDPTVFIVEDDEAVCLALKLLFQSVKLNVQTYCDSMRYLQKHDNNRYGCLIIDMRMPGMSGLELQEQLIKLNNPLPIIFISGHADIPTAVRAVKAGALDFVTKPFHNQTLLELVQHAILTVTQPKYLQPPTIIANRLQRLTRRELQVAKHVVDGKLNKQIASDLDISISTVEMHRAHIMQKMEAKTLAELIRMYVAIEKIQF